MTAALFTLKRIRSVQRPALAVEIPAPGRDRPLLLLDVGASADARSSHLVQFAYLGSAFAEAVLGLDRPAGRPAVGRRRGQEGQRGRGRGARVAGRGERDPFRRQRRGPRAARSRGRGARHRRLHRQRRAEDDRGDRESGRRGGPLRGPIGPASGGRRAAAAPGPRRPSRGHGSGRAPGARSCWACAGSRSSVTAPPGRSGSPTRSAWRPGRSASGRSSAPRS